MNILQIIRYTFSPNSFQKENPEDYAKTKEMLSDENIRTQYMYRMDEEEKIKLSFDKEKELENVADKHWRKFHKEFSTVDVGLNHYPISNTFLLLNRLAAGFLFILNPWMIYKAFHESLNSDVAIQYSPQTFLFSVETLKNWKDFSLEVSLFLLVFPAFVVVLNFFLQRKKEQHPILYLLTSLSIGLNWGYYWITGSDSVLPFLSSIIVALIGIIVYLYYGHFKKTMVRPAWLVSEVEPHHNTDEHR